MDQNEALHYDSAATERLDVSLSQPHYTHDAQEIYSLECNEQVSSEMLNELGCLSVAKVLLQIINEERDRGSNKDILPGTQRSHQMLTQQTYL